MTPARADSGFTLTEMLAVLTLLTLVTAVSIPFARESGEAHELSAVARSIAAVLGDARTVAVSRNSTVEVKVDIEMLTVTGPSGSPVKLPARTEIIVTTDRDQIDRVTAGFKFHPDGGSTGGRIVLRRDGETREIAVNWLTGAIAVTMAASPP